MELKKIAVIGAGTIGRGVAADLLLNGLNVILVDVSKEKLAEAKLEILQTVKFAPLLKKDLSPAGGEGLLKGLRVAAGLPAAGESDFVIENVYEKWPVKEEVYRELDKICDPRVCFGANTSCLSITKIGRVTGRPGKIIGMHFMNPVFLKSTVEVIMGFHTTKATLDTAESLLSLLKKEAIVVNDSPGFVSNRLSHLFMNEAAFVVQDNGVKPNQVDEIFKKCFGHKMGPLETADLIGLDTVVDSLDVLYDSYKDPKFRCCPLLRKMVDAGLLGKKAGKGFYIYTPEKKTGGTGDGENSGGNHQ